MNREENSYYNEQLDFYIEKPSGWDFWPTQWAMNLGNSQQLIYPPCLFFGSSAKHKKTHIQRV